MKPSEALTAHRDELRQLVSHYNVAHPRVYGSVLTGMDDEESDLDLLVDPTERTTLFTLAGLERGAQQLNHRAKEYVRYEDGTAITTNTLES